MTQLKLGFLQNVFNEISLERNFKLWQSTDARLVSKRIKFLSEFNETAFEDQLGRERPRKSEKLSAAFKQKGDDFLKSGDLKKSISLYNAALCQAIDGNELTAEIFIARGQAFRENGSHIDALKDLIEADRHQSSRQNLQLRIDCFSDCLKSKNDQKLLDSYRKALDENDTSGIRKLEENLFTSYNSSQGSNFTGFTDSITIAETTSQGRFTVAAKNISAGELIAIDKPTAVFLDNQFSKSHCWHCLKFADLRILACPGCAGVIFCSEVCKKNANDSYHRFECGSVDVLYQSDIGVWVLAFRVVASSARQYWSKATAGDENVLNLVSHEGSENFLAPELMKEALVAVFLTRCLSRGGYFSSRSGVKGLLGAEELEIAILIHRLMRIARFNSHEVTELVPGTTCHEPKLNTRRIGVAINPYLALINHSCDPNYGRVWVWTDNRPSVYAYATRDIGEREEVCDAYSPTFAFAGKSERDLVLQRYQFQCSCVACDNDWPVITALPKSIPKRDERSKMFSNLLKGKTKILKKDAKSQLSWYVEAVKIAAEILSRPHPLLYELEEDVHKCLWFCVQQLPR